MIFSFTCSCCGEIHEELPFTWGADAPAFANSIPENEWKDRIDLNSDQCVIDGKYFFILGRIEIPIIDTKENFYWLAWVSLSEENFVRASELWATVGRENEPPYFGWLQSEFYCYSESTLNLKTNLHTQPLGERPLVELEPTDHPLSIEQRNGITLQRVQQIAERFMHG